MGPIIIAAVAILAAMAMRKKPEPVASSTSAFSPHRKFVPTSGGGSGQSVIDAGCFEGLDAAAQKQLATVLTDKSVTPAKLFQMSRGHADAGFQAIANCLYNVARERLVGCAPTKEGRDQIKYLLNDPATNSYILKKSADNFDLLGQSGAAKCIRDFAAMLPPGAHP